MLRRLFGRSQATGGATAGDDLGQSGDPGPAAGQGHRLIPVIARSIVVYGVLLSLAISGLMFATQTYEWFNPDFGVFWTTARALATWQAVDLYDPRALTAVNPWPQHPAYGLRPWVYPPTAILFIGPLDALPMWWAFGVWIAICAVAYAWAGSLLSPGRRWLAAGILIAAFPALSALNTGQTSPLMAALIVGLILSLDRRPVLAGLLLATAGVIKPSLLVLAPLALIAGRHFAAFVAAGVFTVLYVGLSVALYGLEAWWAWKAQLDGFMDLVVQLGIHDRAITPTAFGRFLELSPGLILALKIAGMALGAGLAVAVFARTTDPAFRLVALVGGSFLAVPYAMHYDVAALLPAAVALMLRRPVRAWELSLTFLGTLALFPLPPVSALITALVVCGIAGVAILRPDVRVVPARTGSKQDAPVRA